MPHTKSAEKRWRQSEKRNRYNRAIKKTIKNQIKQFEQTVKTGTVEDAQKQFNLTAKKLDKAAARRVIHKNKAARKKSVLATHLAAKKKAGNPAPASA
jgi:small subunit ribosomal protein S20